MLCYGVKMKCELTVEPAWACGDREGLVTLVTPALLGWLAMVRAW
jgi:hypothetical protein